MLSLVPDRRRRWNVKLDWLSRPSIKPSVWQSNECGCHFWVERGDINWCADGRPKMTDCRVT